MLASTVMLESAGLLNDAGQRLFTDAVLLPFLTIASRNLQEKMLLHNLDIIIEDSSAQDVAALALYVPAISDLAIPIELHEKADGAADSSYHPMTEVTEIDPTETQIERLEVWKWGLDPATGVNKIYLRGATVDTDVLVRYKREVGAIASASSVVVARAASFLSKQTAAIAAFTISKDMDKAAVLSSSAQDALNDFLGIEVQGMQNRPVKRRPTKYRR